MRWARRTTVLWGLSVALAAASARGDGVCEKGYRDTTAAERAAMTRALETAKTQLPAAPEGWVIRGDDQISVTQGLCRDFESSPWSYGFGREYSRVDDYEARQETLRAAGADMKADLAAKQPRLDAVMAKMQALAQRQAALATKGDYTGAQALNTEMEKLQAEYQKIFAEGDTNTRMQSAAAEAGRDMFMHAKVTVNPRRESPVEGAEALRLAAGVQSAFRWTETREGIEEGHALVLIGPWRRAADGGFEPAYRAGVGMAVGQAMTVRFTADPSRLGPMLDAMNFGALAAALAK